MVQQQKEFEGSDLRRAGSCRELECSSSTRHLPCSTHLPLPQEAGPAHPQRPLLPIAQGSPPGDEFQLRVDVTCQPLAGGLCHWSQPSTWLPLPPSEQLPGKGPPGVREEWLFLHGASRASGNRSLVPGDRNAHLLQMACGAPGGVALGALATVLGQQYPSVPV